MMKLFSKIKFRFLINFLRLFFENTWFQITLFLDILAILILFIPTIDDFQRNIILGLTLISALIVAICILRKGNYKILERPTTNLLEHTYHINALVLSPDEKLLASCSGDHYAILWDLQMNKPIFRMHHSAWVANVVFSPDNKYLYTLISIEGTINQWDLNKRKKIYSRPRFEKQAKDQTAPNARGLSISEDGMRMSISSDRGSFVYIDPDEPDFYFPPQKIASDELRNTLVFDKKIVFSSAKGEIFMYDTSREPWNYDLIFKDKDQEMIRKIDINPQKNFMAFTNSAGYLYLLNLKNKKYEHVKAHNGHAVAVCFNQSGNFIATGGQDNIICIWKSKGERPKKLFEIHGHSDTVTSLTFNRLNILYSASRDKTIKVWDLKGLE